MIINRIFITVFLLSVVGTVVGITFLAVQSFLYRHTSAEFLVKINMIVILAFVLPFFYILGMLDHTNYYLSKNNLLVVVEQGTTLSRFYEFREAIGFADKISVLWLVGVGVFLLFYMVSNSIFQYRIRKSAREIESGPWREQLRTLCLGNEFPKKQIRLIASTWETQICTVGMLHKTIIIPEYLLDKLSVSEISIILRHELTHICKNDVAFKIGMFVLSSLNWFNPLIYYLNQSLNEWIELSCDEEMLRYADSVYRHAYIDALLKILAEQMEQKKLQCCSAIAYFNNGKSIRHIKRRMNGIMKKRVAKKATQVLAVSGILCTIACGTALARDIEYPLNSVLSNCVGVFDSTEYFETPAVENYDRYGDTFLHFSEEAMETPFTLHADADYEIVYPDDSWALLTAEMLENERIHTHTSENVNINKHKKKSDGSCTITTYAGAKCTECGYITYGKVIATTTYPECPH